MKFNSFLVKSALFCASLLVLACGQSGGTHVSCALPQNVGITLRQATAFSTSGALQVIVKMTNENLDYEKFRLDLISAHGKSQQSSQKFSMDRISENTYSISLPAQSPAVQVIERAVEDQKIHSVEADFETFSTEQYEQSSEQVLDSAQIEQVAASTTETNAQARKQIIVAVIDTGVDYTHKDLAPYMWKNPKEIPGNGIDDDHNGFIDDTMGWNFVNNDNDPMADDTRSFHGTHVAGIVKTASQLSQQGIDVKIMALKYLDAGASGLSSNAIKAIDYAVKNGAAVLNNSWGSFNSSKALSDAIERARKANVLFIAAAGNGDAAGNGINIDQMPFYPAAYPHDNIISVAAGDQNGALTKFSNYGTKSVDISAPGLNIRSTRNGNTYGILSGTSMASPYVAGVAAMLWGLRSDLSYREVKKVLMKSTAVNDSLNGKIATAGAINPVQAVRMVASFSHDPNDVYTPEFNDSTDCSQP